MNQSYHLLPARVYTDDKDDNANIVGATTSNNNKTEETIVNRADEFPPVALTRLRKSFSIKRLVLLFILGAAFGTFLEFLSIQSFIAFGKWKHANPQSEEQYYVWFIKLGMVIDMSALYIVIFSYLALLAYRVTTRRNSKRFVSARTSHSVASISAGMALGFCIGMWAFFRPMDTWFTVQFVVEEFFAIYCAYMFAIELQLAREQRDRGESQEELSEALLPV